MENFITSFCKVKFLCYQGDPNWLGWAEMEEIQQQMVEAKKNERANALKEVKRLCKEFGFTAGMLKGSLAEGRKSKV